MLKQFSYLRIFPNYFLIEYFDNQELHTHVDRASVHYFEYPFTEYIIFSEYIFNNFCYKTEIWYCITNTLSDVIVLTPQVSLLTG